MSGNGIDRANLGHIELIMELEESGFDPRDQWSQSSWTSELLAGDRIVLVAPAGDGTVMGAITVQVVGDTADLHRVVVDAGHRRRAVASDLVAAAIERARERGARQLLLEVRTDNHAAIALYSALGFTEISRRGNYYGQGVDAIVMRKDLADHGSGGRDE